MLDSTYRSTGYGREAAHASGSHLLFCLGEALVRFDRAPQRHLVEFPSQKPYCDIQTQTRCYEQPENQGRSKGIVSACDRCLRGALRTLGDEEAPADNDDNTNPCPCPPISAMRMSDGLNSGQSAPR